MRGEKREEESKTWEGKGHQINNLLFSHTCVCLLVVHDKMIRERCQVWKPRKQRKERHTVSKNRRNADARICKMKSQINLAYELESENSE